MEIRFAPCSERNELEHLIHACINSIAKHSSAAVKMTGGSQTLDFARLQTLKADYLSGGCRLETLRECLALHQRLHGC
jgi:hypothetical protein